MESYAVGQTPEGFYQTVPLRRPLPDDLIGISGPPGDDWRAGGMTFRPSELRRDAIYRGGYEFVSPERFARDGVSYCSSRSKPSPQGLALVAVGVGGMLLAGRRRYGLLFVAALLTAGGAFATVAPWFGSPLTVEPRQARADFTRGLVRVPGNHQVLLDMSPATHQPRKADGLYLARILAPDGYAFAIGCSGPSIQIGEESEIDNGVTGGRQLVGCATNRLVRGLISDRGDRGELVEIVVDPNGMSDWRVIVVSGPGDAGPFSEN
jgi:hypothetical protein